MLVKVQCPACKKSIQVPEKYRSKKIKCPGCGEHLIVPAIEAAVAMPPQAEEASTNVERDAKEPLYSHPNAAPSMTSVSEPAKTREPIDYAVLVCLASAPILFLIATGAILIGKNDFAVLVAAVCLMCSLLLIAKYGHLQSIIRTLHKEKTHLDELSVARTRDAQDAIDKYEDFKSNYDKVVASRLAEIQKINDEERERLAHFEASSQEKLDRANERNHTIDRLGKRLLNDSVKWIGAKITPNNFTASSERLKKVIEFCRKHEYAVDKSLENELLDNLRTEFEDALRKQHAKDEQQRIKARIREEQRAEKELGREMRRIEAEKNAIEKALAVALKKAKDQHSEEVDALREKLRDAEEKSQRALSMAQQTKAGNVDVISNIGSFGEGVYKIGMTRRLELR